jgi:gas vesicle protein
MQSTLAKQLAAQLATQGVRVKGSGGLQVTRAGGYIPTATRMAEVVGAQAGGYTPGRVVSSPVGGVMNTAEDIKYIPGFAQPFINPPAGSKAGRAHRQNSINRTGVDPYMFNGFIPNFVKKSPSQFSVGRAFEQSVGFDIKVPPSRNKPIDFKEVLEKPINKNFNPKLYQSNTFADAHSGLGHTSAENISKVINHIGQNYYAYSPKQGSKTKRLKIDDKTSIISQPDLLGDLFIRPRYTEIIGEGLDVPNQIKTSSISSLNTTAKKTLLNGVSELDFNSILRRKIKMQFAQDRVYGSGFIPNFATPMSTASIPWFKKYSSKYKNASGDTDLFKMGDFPTYGRGLDHEYAKKGNSAMLSYLHEDFVRSALNIALGSKKVIRPAEVGFKNKPVSDIANENDFDLLYRIADGSYSMLELKQDFKNVSGSVTGFMNKKLANLEKENPVLAKKVSSMIAVSNRPKFTDPTGRNAGANFSEFEMAAASIVKDKYSNVDPSISAKLTKVTDGLLRRYEVKKNSYSKGFIPNFASRSEMIRDLIRFNLESTPDVKNKNVFGSKTTLFRGVKNRGGRYSGQFGRDIFEQSNNYSQAKNSFDYFRNTDINEIANDHVSEKKLLPFVSASMDEDIAKYFARGRQDSSFSDEGKVGSKTIKNSRIFSAESIRKFTNKYGQEALKQLMMEHSTWGSFGSGKGIAMNFQSFSDKKGFEGTDFAKEISFLSKGFVPNFADFIDVDTLTKNSVHYSGDLMKLIKDIESSIGRNLSSGELRFLSSPKTDLSKLNGSNGPNVLNRFINSERKGGFAQFAKGFLPNFNFIKGRNSFQKNWLIETAKKRNLNLNDPNVFSKLGAEFAKTYPNDQGMFGLSEGFIPNFAYKQAVMGLEESMSGNKAIFDTKPFPHIRNSSQPTFSSAIADHGGLGNALSDSMRGQKAAGLMHGGFIPNFGNSRSARRKMARNQTQSQSQNAQSGFDPAILQAEAEKIAKNVVKKMKYAYDYIGVFAAAFADTIEKGSQQAKAALSSGMSKIKVSASNLGANVSNSVNNAASNATNQNTSGGGGKSIIGAVSKRLGRIAANPFTTIAGNMLAGQIESFYTGGKSREKLTEQERFKSSAFSNVLASGSTGLQIGGMIGGAPGAVIGGVLGGLTGLITAINSSKTNLDDLTKIYEEKKIKEKESFDAASEYIQAKSKIAANENIKDANKLGKEASLAFANIKDSNLKNALSDAGNDVVKMTNILNEYTLKQKEATLNIETFSANLVGLTKERAKEVGMKTTGPTSGLYGLEIVQSLKSMLTKDTSALTKLDLIDPDTQKAVYQQNEQFFSMFRNVQSESLKKIQAGISGMYVSFIPDFVGNFEKSINSITELSKDQKEVLIATLKKGKETGSVLVKTLADPAAFNKLFSELSMYFALKKAEEIITTKNAEAVADLNFQLKKSIIYLNTRIQDESRLLNQEKRLRQVKSKTEGYVTEQLYGKREMASYQYKIAMSDIGASRSIKDLDSISKVITTNVEGLSDAQKIDLAKTRESLDLKDPQKALAQMRGFAQRTFGTLDPLKLVDSQKTFVEAIDAASEELRKNSKDAASDLEEAAAQLKAAFEEINLSSNFMFQFKAGFRDLANEGEALIGTIGRQIPKMFADGLVDGIKAAIRESDNLGQALMGIAAKFLDELSTMMLRSSIYQIMGSFAPSLVQGYGVDLSGSIRKQQKGGVIRAQSGMYVSGSGTGDKYPALLENGEYVLNRRAVMAMGGPASLDQLNFAMAPRFASGGSFSNEFIDLKSMESNMTSYGMENSKLYGELRDAEVAAAEERRRKAFARKQQRAGMIGSLVAAVASIGLAQGMSNITQNAQSKQAQALSGKLTSGANLTKAESASIKPFIDKGLISPYSGAYTGGSSYSGVKSFFSGPTAYGQSPWYQKMNPFGKQTGGLIGSRLSDTIPGYMEGGLYNTPIVKRYGVGMQSGGMSPVSNSNSNVVNTTNATNSFNFNTNVSRDGTIEVGSNSTSYAQQDVALSKNLNSKVYAVVLDAIKNEQRFGGSLAGTRQG